MTSRTEWQIQNVIRIKFVLYWLLMALLTITYLYVISSTNCMKANVSCLLIALTFVGSLYAWKSHNPSDHPSTIKKRCISVFFMIMLSPGFVYLFATNVHTGQLNKSLLELLGVKTSGCSRAAVLPVLLTMVLFAGPLCLRALDGVFWQYLDKQYWSSNCRNLVWIRNHIVAPFSEEFSFRACMLPLLVTCYSKSTAIFVCPLFFGVAHAHHLIERIRLGGNVKRAVLETIFQFAYTTVFGAYSAFLFLRTGHFISSFIVHSFCNHMGFPDFGDILNYAQPKRSVISGVFCLGFIMWCFLLYPLTEPSLYYNDIY